MHFGYFAKQSTRGGNQSQNVYAVVKKRVLPQHGNTLYPAFSRKRSKAGPGSLSHSGAECNCVLVKLGSMARASEFGRITFYQVKTSGINGGK
ncbi:hypothetical protein K0M31_001038 [Melipona bicolor]|uniref:Uncharacterized protein n=1 Tax=Melipona bicolor TaxID=60889 RepID=A0AA40KXF4_9HYME|nr:hypothetical protein K0M31_001038 [Melipona bicolor]